MMSQNGNDSMTLEAILLVLVAAALGLIMSVYVLMDRDFNRVYEVPLEPIVVPAGDAVVREGRRLAQIRGCFWCHGDQLQGKAYFASARRGVMVIAPDLTRRIQEFSAAEFARAVRNGVRPDGTSLQPAMPSFAFYNMSDADLGAIMAYIASVPEQNGFEGKFQLWPIGWFRWVGFGAPLPPNVADMIDHKASRPSPALEGTLSERGRYLAESICTECHSDNGRIRVPGTPELYVASAYNESDFYRLIRTGVPIGEREIDYHMVEVSQYRYTEFTEEEIEALYTWFQTMQGFSASALQGAFVEAP